MANQTEMTVYHVKNFSNAELKRILRSLGACDDGIRFVKHHDARSAWEACEDSDWIEWLISNADGKFGLPPWAEYEKVKDQALAEYKKVKDQAWAEYLKTIKAMVIFEDDLAPGGARVQMGA